MPQGTPNYTKKGMNYWKLKLQVIWADLYGSLEEYLDAREVFEVYEVILEEEQTRQKALSKFGL